MRVPFTTVWRFIEPLDPVTAEIEQITMKDILHRLRPLQILHCDGLTMRTSIMAMNNEARRKYDHCWHWN